MKWIRPTVIIAFFAWLCFSLSIVNKIEVGLDQEVSMPDDSYMLKYFDYMEHYLSVGPPFYLVVNNTGMKFDFSDKSMWERLCGRAECDEYSLANQLKLWSLRGNVTYVASSGAQSFIDDYISYLTTKGCCTYDNVTLELCPIKTSTVSSESHSALERLVEDHTRLENTGFGDDQVVCHKKVSCYVDNASYVEEAVFRSYLPYFLEQDPNPKCASAGHAAYVNAIKWQKHKHPEGLGIPIAPNPPDSRFQEKEVDVTVASFMAFHTILRTSKDYYEALRWARRLGENITETLNKDLDIPEEQKVIVFPYSVFYVFYEQYLTMWEDTLRSLAISLSAIFFVTFFLMGLDIRSAAIVVGIIAMILINMGGFMYWWGITLNAVSLVNLVMAIGISVEFCAHITHAFAISVGESKVDRAKHALVNMGSSVRL